MSNETGWWIPHSDQISRIEFSREFLRREVGVRLFSGEKEINHQLYRVESGLKALAFVDTSVIDLRALDCFPKRSVVLFILSDETYKFTLNIRALTNKKIFAIVRDYPIGRPSLVREIPRVVLSKLRRVRYHSSLLQLFPRALVSAFYLSSVQVLIYCISRLTKRKVYEIPLGYDSGFCEQFAKFYRLKNMDSLLGYSLSAEQKIMREKNEPFFFLGQQGNFDRQLFLREAKKLGIEVDNINHSYAAGRKVENQQRYFHGLRYAVNSLCPPGQYSGNTFRYMESLLMYSYPLCERFILSDPLFRDEMDTNWEIIQEKKENLEILNLVTKARTVEIVQKMKELKIKIDVVRALIEINSNKV